MFRTPRRELEALGLRPDYALKLESGLLDTAAKALEDTALCGGRFIAWGEEGYPPLLAECPDAPLGLYYKGCSEPQEVFSGRPCIAVVGTRDMSSYGREWTVKIVSAMSRCPVKPLVVSGLAYGVDFTAHSSALENGLSTAAVMGTGIDEVYPFRHGFLADSISDTPLICLLTDFPPGTSPMGFNFLRRNRIIAGICSATILIESRIRGGGMNTARVAFSYDRDVHALPGRADDLRSGGCNALISEKIADLVSDPGTLMVRLGLGKEGKVSGKVLQTLLADMYGDDKDTISVAMKIKAERDITLDGLCMSLGMDNGKVASIAGMLESDGIISRGLLGNCTINVKYS